jgi:hypothetical protein
VTELLHKTFTGAGSIWRLLWLPVVLSGALYAVLRLLGRTVAYWQLWLLALAVVLATYLVRAARGITEDDLAEAPAADRVYIKDRPFAEVNRWEERLTWGEADAERFQRTVQRRIAELIAERLRLRHGVVLAHEPARAKDIIGAELFQLATVAVTAPLTQSDMDDVVRRIEEI